MESFIKNFSRVPRDRNGSFEKQLIPELIPDYVRRTDELETTIIILYRKGITTREITDLIEKIYGQHYSPATMSRISKAVVEQVETFHKRPLSERYVVIFMDATYLNVRRGSAAKEHFQAPWICFQDIQPPLKMSCNLKEFQLTEQCQ